MKKQIAIIGGDERIIQLAKLYEKEESAIKIYGFENWEEKQNENWVKNIEEAVVKAQIIISSIPFSKDDINIYAPYSKEKIKISELTEKIKNKTLIAGNLSKETIELCDKNSIETVDLLQQEDLTILNTIATAEGTIGQIISNTKYNIHGSKILILGFGRVAKTLAKKLSALDAKVTCSARKNKDFAWIETFGLEKSNINNLAEDLQRYDIIINTVPHLILDESKLKYINKETLLIDLASKPGGIEFNACEKLGLKYIWALAIPGKVAPITTAKYIKTTIDNIIGL